MNGLASVPIDPNHKFGVERNALSNEEAPFKK